MKSDYTQPHPDLNQFKTYLPEGAIARFGKGYVFDMQYAHDGSKFAVASTIGIWLYDTETWDELNLLTGHSYYVSGVEFSPDGKTLASMSCWNDHTIRLWDVETGETKAVLTGHTKEILSLVFSPDGMTLASAGEDQTIRLWDVSSGTLKRTFDEHNDQVNVLSYNPDGSRLASGGKDEVVRIYDTQSDELALTFAAHVNSVDTLNFSSDGNTLVSQGADNKVYFWHADSGELMQEISDNTNTKYTCDISDDGNTIVVADSNGTIHLCNSQTGDVVRTINLETELDSVATTYPLRGCQCGTDPDTKLGSVIYSPDNRTIACYDNRDTIHLLDMESETFLHTFKTPDRGSVNSYRYSMDGSTLAISNGLEINVWNVRSGELESTISGYAEVVGNAVFSPDGKTLVSLDDVVRIWDVGTHKLLSTISDISIASVAYSPDGQTLACGTYDNTILLFDTEAWQHRKTLEGHADTVTTLAFSPDGETLASGSSDNTIRLWHSITGEQIYRLKGHTESVNDLAFSPDCATLASGGWDGTIRFWDAASGELLRTIEIDQDNSIDSVAFSSDGLTLACTGENGDIGIRFWDVSTGGHLKTIDVEAGAYSVVYSPDGRTFASGGIGELSVWDAASGKIMRTLTGHIDPVYSIAYSADGQTLASGCRDSTVILWDLMA